MFNLYCLESFISLALKLKYLQPVINKLNMKMELICLKILHLC